MSQVPQIPILDFSEDELGLLEVGSERWKELCIKVREASECHGCFFLVYDKIPTSLREDMFAAMKALFDLPEETKNKYVNPKHYRSYMGKCPLIPLFEGLGVDDAQRLDAAQAFTNLMWPDGNPSFCEAFNGMSSKMLELSFLIMKMIFESFGMERLYDSYVEDNTGVFRVMKYKVPPRSSDEKAVALPAHSDKNGLTILCQSEVQGLEVQTYDGDWVLLQVPKDTFTVIVGDALKAWSNGRLHAVMHRVVTSGNKERYSCGLFSMPKDEALIEVPQELVDQERPLQYRPFNFTDYISYFIAKPSDNALETFAGI